MASRKKEPPSTQLGLGSPARIQDPVLPSTTDVRGGGFVDKSSAADLDLESFDDYDDDAKHEDVPRLRLVDPPRDAPTVIVESVGEVFEVSRLRDNGTTVACVMWTREELLELQRRIAAALEM